MVKIIMLAGAPRMRTCHEKDLTVNSLLPVFASLVDDETIDEKSLEVLNGSKDSSIPVWRQVPTMHTKYLNEPSWQEQPHSLLAPKNTATVGLDLEISFLTSTSSIDEVQDHAELSQYLEKSFALHEQAKSTQFAQASTTPVHCKQERPSPSGDTELATPQTSFTSTSSLSPFNSPTIDCSPTPVRPDRRFSLPNLTDLARVPNAATIENLEPQTVTVDLLVGVISVSAPRTVTIRRTGKDIELLEVLVGDDTKAGFCVTFWLPNQTKTPKPVVPDLRQAVTALRPGNIIGMQNIALTRFRGVVHGQSLAGRGLFTPATSVFDVQDTLSRRITAYGLTPALTAKIERVKHWTRSFVPLPVRDGAGADVAAAQNPAHRQNKKRKFNVYDAKLPPDDTQ